MLLGCCLVLLIELLTLKRSFRSAPKVLCNMNVGVDQMKVQCRLIELTEASYNLLDMGDNEKAVEYFEKAAKMSMELGNASAVVPCYLNAGACLIYLGKFQRGHRFLQSALKMLRNQRAEREDQNSRNNFGRPTSSCSSKLTGSTPEDATVRMSADIHHYLGVVHQAMEDYQKALAHFQLSAKLYIKDQSCSGQAAESFTHSSHCYHQIGDLEMEASNLKKAEEIYHQLRDSYNEARICMKLAQIYLGEGRSNDSKQMLSSAKLLCQCVENCVEERKLHSELGLLYINMGQFDSALQSFEQALILVQKGRRTSTSLQDEASILQNIGAAYNEKGMFPEAVAYHKEAAALHGKLGNYNSESMCLCNLASAQTQLDQLQEATVTFNKALAAAHHADNIDLRFQAYEGLGSIQLHWGRHGEAVCYFERAVVILDHIKEDPEIARERIMEKFSEALKLLEQTKRAMEEENVSQGECLAREMKLGDVWRDDKNEEGSSNVHAKRMTRSSSPESVTATLSPSNSPRVPLPHRVKKNRGKITLQERRGIGGRLPFLRTSGMGSPQSPSRLKLSSHPSKRDKERLQQHPTNGHSESTYSAKLQTYMNSYKSSQDDNDIDFKTSLRGPSSIGIPDGSQSPVKEGCLAIGAQAREKFKVQTVEEGSEKLKGRKAKGRHQQGKRNEIVSTSASQRVESTSSEERESNGDSVAQARTSTQQQSKLCTIL